jgi:hypothetical protein
MLKTGCTVLSLEEAVQKLEIRHNNDK